VQVELADRLKLVGTVNTGSNAAVTQARSRAKAAPALGWATSSNI